MFPSCGAIASIILYLRTAHDIFGILAVGMGICSLIWGLTIAHWSIHLLALLALFCFRKPFMGLPALNSKQ